MREFRLQEMVPQVYCDESRDFQVFCRAYDLTLNGVKFDVDTIKKLTSTLEIRDNMLPLLQEKIGFFSNKNYSSKMLRIILSGFPYLVKNKGSLNAIKGAANLYLQAIGVRTPLIIWYSKKPITQNGYNVPERTVLIGIDAGIKSIYILDEIFRYILPIGIRHRFFKYTSITPQDIILLNETCIRLYASESTNGIVGNDDSAAVKKTMNVDTIRMVSTPQNGTRTVEVVGGTITTNNTSGADTQEYYAGDEAIQLG